MKKKNRAQEYLEQVEKINALIENKKAERDQCEDIALSVTAHSDGERVQSSGGKQKMADAVDNKVDLQSDIDRMIVSLAVARQDIIRTIEQLNATEYDVLHKRYIQGMSFDEIGAAKRKSKSWATTVHGRALQNLNLILDERDRLEAERFKEMFERFKTIPASVIDPSCESV